jgi:diguanylate cyclase (GGDEF)-like protein/PAS domain S-box-containing protein
MGFNFSPRESRALFGLLADSPTDIVLKLDREGFVLHASGAVEQLGLPASGGMLIGPHLLDFVHSAHAAAVRTQFETAIAGSRQAEWLELAASAPGRDEQWFEIRTRPLARRDGGIYGAISVMRSIERRKSLERQLFAAELTDALTGLTNRKAFSTMLDHLVSERIGGCLALFTVDYLAAINMRFGHATGDRALVAFSDLLRTMMRRGDIISRVGGRCLGVLLPRTSPEQARDLCQRVVDTLCDIGREARQGAMPIGASTGIARIANSFDDTMNRAELALFLAQAKGRNRLELDDWTELERWTRPGAEKHVGELPPRPERLSHDK